MNNSSLLQEITLQCNDTSYREFPKTVYEQALYRSKRKLSKKYGLLKKIYSFVLSEKTDDLTADVILDIPDFKEEILVTVNDVPYTKVSTLLETHGDYYLSVVGTDTFFNYFSVTKALTDEIDILYNIIPDKETDENDYYIPSKYEEELIRMAIQYIAKLGIAKYIGDTKQKYTDLYKMNEERSDIDKELPANTEWATIKVWKMFSYDR